MNTHRSRLLLAAAVLAAVAGSAQAADPEDIIAYRRAHMKATAGHMAAAAAIIQGKVDYKNRLGDHTKALQVLSRDIPALFPKDSDFGETRALDAVWSKNAEFQKRAKEAQAAADALAKTVAAGSSKDYAARFKVLNDACKACHKDFRKEEQ